MIKKVVSVNKKNNYVTVTFDDNSEQNLFADIFLEHKLFVGSELDDNKLLKIIEQNEERIVINYAKKILSNRLYSIKDIENKLLSKTNNTKIIKLVINKLIEYKYLDDEEYAKQFIKSRLLYKKKGKVKIKYDLLKQGVDLNIINRLLDEIDDESELKCALNLAKAKFDIIENSNYEDNSKLKAKIYRFLQSRGFSNKICLKVLKSLFNNNWEYINE